jgi:hypothetical protein
MQIAIGSGSSPSNEQVVEIAVKSAGGSVRRSLHFQLAEAQRGTELDGAQKTRQAFQRSSLPACESWQQECGEWLSEFNGF